MLDIYNDTLGGTYPFTPRYFDIGDFRMHYVDEGRGKPVVLVHGDPTWGYMYRKFIPVLSEDHRCIVPDHMGMGKSGVPEHPYPYRLTHHIANLEKLLLSLDLKDITLVLHDWGGPVGMGFAVRHPALIKRLVIMNTWAFAEWPGGALPKLLRIIRSERGGPFVLEKNGYVKRAFTGTQRFLRSKTQATSYRKTHPGEWYPKLRASYGINRSSLLRSNPSCDIFLAGGEMQKLTVGILIYDGVQVLDFAGPFDVFSTTRHKDKPALSDPSLFDVLLVSEYPRPVTALGGMKVIPHHTFNDCPALDILVVPGGLGEREEHGNHVILHFVRRRAKEVKTLASVCTGAFFLGKAGLLDNRRATTHWLSIDRMRETFPDVEVVENVRYVEDGNIITSAGISAGIDMALRVVAIHLGEVTARATARELEYLIH